MSNVPTAIETFFRIVPLNGGVATGSDGQPLPGRKFVDWGGAAVDDPSFQYAGKIVGRTLISAGGGIAPAAAFVKPPLVASLTWVQKDGLVVPGTSSAVDTLGGGFDILSPTPGDNAHVMHMLLASAPNAGPWTFTLGLQWEQLATANDFHIGLVARESASGKLLVLNLSDQIADALGVSQWSSPTAIVTDDYLSSQVGIYATTQAVQQLGPIWLRLQNTGTHLLWSRSYSGASIYEHIGLLSSDGFSSFPVPKNDYFAVGPNQFGIGVSNVLQAGPAVGARIFSWAVTTP